MDILDKTTEELIRILTAEYKGNDFIISDKDVQLPSYIEKNLRDELRILKDNNLISHFEIWITGGWEVIIRPRLLSYFEDKEKMISQRFGNTNNFFGNVFGAQIQQGTTNSSQKQIITQEINYETIDTLIVQIRKCDLLLDSEFGENANRLREIVDEMEQLVKEKKNPKKIKLLLEEVKNLAIGVGGSLIASGIMYYLERMI